MNTLRPTAVGLGFKPAFFNDAMAESRTDCWFEVHPENYQVAGGPRRDLLRALAGTHPLSLHSVSLSLASPEPVDEARLSELAEMNRELAPALVSEHLAWSWWKGVYAPDLLPVVRSDVLLQHLSDNIDRVQVALGRTIALENPSHYVPLSHEWDEVDFLHALARRTGCCLLVDVNNVAVSAHNLGLRPIDWLDRIDGALIAEIHLAGYHPDPVLGNDLWIDGHDQPIAEGVWQLYERLIARIGPRPTLIERDDQLPPYAELQAEADRARQIMSVCSDTVDAHEHVI